MGFDDLTCIGIAQETAGNFVCAGVRAGVRAGMCAGVRAGVCAGVFYYVVNLS